MPTVVMGGRPTHRIDGVGGQTVLVVDDDPVIQKLLEINFEMDGYRVLVAPDGLQGLAMAREAKPAIVLLDVMMPGMNGLEVAVALRNDPSTATIPIIILSAKAQESDIAAALAAGVDDYILKPFDPMGLLERARCLIADSRGGVA